MNEIVDQTVSMLENVQENLQKPTTTAALVHHPEVVIKREPQDGHEQAADEENEFQDGETEGSIKSNDPNQAFIEVDDAEDRTPGNFHKTLY